MPTTINPVWFIADASAGLAAALAEAVLQSGQRAVLAAREPARLAPLLERYPRQASALALDVLDAASIQAAVCSAERDAGRIDVLVASAFQRYAGAVEEGDAEAVRALFEENVFAPVNLARSVLPGMRARRSGHIVMLARGAVAAPAGEGFGHAARSALEALTEALFYEVERLGIGVTLVDPGESGLDGYLPSGLGAAEPIADYADLAGQRAARSQPAAQSVDGARAAQAIMHAVGAGRGPLRLVLGRAALRRAYDRLRILKVGFDAWAELAESADAPAAPGAGAATRSPRQRATTV